MSLKKLTPVVVAFSLIWAPLYTQPTQAAWQAPAPAASLKVVIIDGDEAANVVQEKMAAEPVIEVRDEQDRKVAGAVVRFKIRKAVGKRLSAAFRGGNDEVRTLTDAVGQARAGTLTPLEPGPFEIDVEATHNGKTAQATMRHTNYATSDAARADGRQPVQRTAAVAAAAVAAGSGGSAGGSGAAGASAPSGNGAAAGTARAAGGGLSKTAIIGIAAGGVAGVGAIALAADGGGGSSSPAASTPTTPVAPPGRVTGVTATVSSGLMAATSFAFSAQTADYVGSLTYRWDFGDSTTSTEASPTKVYAAAGTYTVAVTIADARGSARSEMSVTVYSLSGRWVNPASATTYVFTQTGSALTGTVTGTSTGSTGTPWTYTNCPLSGAVKASAPMVTFNRPECRNGAPGTSFLVVGDFRLDLSANGQTLSGEATQPAPFGTQAITLQRQ